MDLQATDIDWAVVERERSVPAAIVEYKHERARDPDPEEHAHRALGFLATNSGIPYIVCKYNHTEYGWIIRPFNSVAKRVFAERGWSDRQEISERQWIQFMEELRG